MTLARVLLFPPFENHASTTRMSGTWFDGFHFTFGDKLHRRFYLPPLYLEVLWVPINGAVLWLLFREPPQPATGQSRGRRMSLMTPGQAASPRP